MMATHRELSQYTESNQSDHEVAKRAIAETLRNEHRGKDNAISSKELAEKTSVSASTVRDLIAEVRRDYGLPIGSANGYFVVADVDELETQIDRQKRQAETSLQTARELAKAWNGKRHG